MVTSKASEVQIDHEVRDLNPEVHVGRKLGPVKSCVGGEPGPRTQARRNCGGTWLALTQDDQSYVVQHVHQQETRGCYDGKQYS